MLYCAFNALVAFPRMLASLPAGGGLNLAMQLRYCNAQPLLTCNLVTMVSCPPHGPQEMHALRAHAPSARTWRWHLTYTLGNC